MTALRLYSPTIPPPTQPAKPTLSEFYESEIYPEIRGEQTPDSIANDRTALRHWQRYTMNRPISEITVDDLIAFRDGMQSRGLANATINKYWREVRSMFNWAAEDGAIDRAPRISRRSKSRLVKQLPKQQREALTVDEVSQLWTGCRRATYPHSPEIPAPKLWRTAIVLFWFYGPRTIDVLKNLTWENVRFSDRLLLFNAQKTSKLQGLPLTDLVIAHLKSIKRNSKNVFPGFKSKGCFLTREKRWKAGYYATWRNEIQGSVGLSGILIKHFREAMVTRCNGIEPGLGGWIAGHSIPGVTAMNYDLPTIRIREAIEKTPVPDCFHDIN